MNYEFYVSEGTIVFRRLMAGELAHPAEIWNPQSQSWRVYLDARDFFTTTHEIDAATAQQLIGDGNLQAPLQRDPAKTPASPASEP